MKTYGQIKMESQAKIDKALSDNKVFFAFGNKQFQENKTEKAEGEKYTDIGGGGFLPSSKLGSFMEQMNEASDTFERELVEFDLRKEHIEYELNNHEAYYTRDITSTVEALGDGYTREEVAKVFDGRK